MENKYNMTKEDNIFFAKRELIGKYFTHLINYYETDDNTEMKKFIYDNCLDGVE